MRRFILLSPSFVGVKCKSTLGSCGIIGKSSVKSVSKWTWSFCRQFVEVVHDPTLSLPTGTPLWSSAEVFAELPIDDTVLCNPPMDKQVFEHCEIEKVMKQMGYKVTDHGVVVPNPMVLDDNRRIVDQLARARREELSSTRHEKKIDQCAQHFLQLCGFDSSPFEITAEGDDFKIFGKDCHSDGDHYVVATPSNDLVLVFEDKSLKFDEVVKQQGHLGQIVGELLQLLSLNSNKKVFRSVFAVRFINYFVTAFRLDVDKPTTNALVN